VGGGQGTEREGCNCPHCGGTEVVGQSQPQTQRTAARILGGRADVREEVGKGRRRLPALLRKRSPQADPTPNTKKSSQKLSCVKLSLGVISRGQSGLPSVRALLPGFRSCPLCQSPCERWVARAPMAPSKVCSSIKECCRTPRHLLFTWEGYVKSKSPCRPKSLPGNLLWQTTCVEHGMRDRIRPNIRDSKLVYSILDEKEALSEGQRSCGIFHSAPALVWVARAPSRKCLSIQEFCVAQ